MSQRDQSFHFDSASVYYLLFDFISIPFLFHVYYPLMQQKVFAGFNLYFLTVYAYKNSSFSKIHSVSSGTEIKHVLKFCMKNDKVI